MVEVQESREFLEDWVEEKLDEGIERKRLKRILRERDRDPEVVDRVASPFDEDDEEAGSEDEESGEEPDNKGGFLSRFLS